MHRLRTLAVGAALLPLCIPAQCPAQDAGAATHIAWENDFDAALQRAQKESKPILVAFLMDDEPANDETIQKHYPDPQIVEISRKFVCLAGCLGEHPGEGGNCGKFPGITCAQHRAIEKKARARWLTSDEVCAPQHVFCDPEGNVIRRKVYLIPKDTLWKCMAATLNELTKDPTARVAVDDDRVRVDGWLADLKSRNLEVREAALRELAVADDDRALPAVLQETQRNRDDPTRLAAIGALGRKGNYAAVEALGKLLTDKDARIVIKTALALETIQIPDASPAALAAFKRERRDRVRGFLLRVAARCTPSDRATREACVRALKGASNQLEACVLVALGWLKPDSTIADAVRPLLKEKNPDTRSLAVWVLGNQRSPDCVEALEALLNDEKTPQVIEIAQTALAYCRGEKVEGYDTKYSRFFFGSDY